VEAAHCSTLDFVRKICVISGSFGANLAKFVTADHDDIVGRFGSTAIDRAAQAIVTHVIDEIYSTKCIFCYCRSVIAGRRFDALNRGSSRMALPLEMAAISAGPRSCRSFSTWLSG
jgi:hypothetical protein